MISDSFVFTVFAAVLSLNFIFSDSYFLKYQKTQKIQKKEKTDNQLDQFPV